jgi:hypothetical protein
MMAYLNYTTDIPAARSVAEIIERLAAHGAERITVVYDGARRPMGLAFAIDTPHGLLTFRLPANIDATLAVLRRQTSERTAGGRRVVPFSAASPEQATRVAWRVLKDWTEAQLAIIEAGMATIDQVLLPYVETPDGRTVYQLVTQRWLELPAGRSG